MSPHLLSVLGYAISGILGIIGTFASVIEIRNYHDARRIRKAAPDELPVQISKSLSYSDLEQAIKLTTKIMDDLRFQPDFVVGVHYTGLSYASLLAKEFYVPVLHVEVEYKGTERHHMADVVTPKFNPSCVAGKRVLLVDNRMATGVTMQLAKDLLRQNGATVKTMVFYKRACDNSVIKPDIVLFTSKKPLAVLVR